VDGKDYFISWEIHDRLFTSPDLEEIIPGYPYNPLHTSVGKIKNSLSW
jgi:hypothetical protein